MGKIKEKMKSIPLAKKIFYNIIKFHPHRLVFKLNLRKVEKFDRKHGTDFSGRMYWNEIGTSRDRANDYSPSPMDLIETLESENISNSDSIVDMGCGKGYAMYLMAKYPFACVGGGLSYHVVYVI